MTLTICIGNLKICKSAFHKEIYGSCLGFSCWQKLEKKPLNYNSHKENCKDFSVSDWNLGKVEEHFPYSVQTCNHFIATSSINEAYHLFNMFKSPLQVHYRDMKVNHLSKSPSSALFFVWKLCWNFLLKVFTTIFLLVCF